MTDDEFRELIEMGHQITELTRQPGWMYLTDRAAATIGAKQRQLLTGQAESLEEYAKRVGWLAGADFVLGLPDRVDAEIRAERDARRERDQTDL